MIIVAQVLGLILLGLLAYGYLRFVIFVTREKSRLRRYRRNHFLLMVLIGILILLMELLLPQNSCLRLVIIPVIVFGAYYNL
jgi:H+/Cl- antiporter ClcA